MIDLLKFVIIIFPIEASDLYYSVVMQAVETPGSPSPAKTSDTSYR
jgi:hypothetical protein